MCFSIPGYDPAILGLNAFIQDILRPKIPFKVKIFSEQEQAANNPPVWVKGPKKDNYNIVVNVSEKEIPIAADYSSEFYLTAKDDDPGQQLNS